MPRPNACLIRSVRDRANNGALSLPSGIVHSPRPLFNVISGTLSAPAPGGAYAVYRIAGIDVHKKKLAMVVADVEVEDEYQFERR